MPGTTYTVSELLTAYERDYLPIKAPLTAYQQGRLYVWLRKELGFMLLTDLTPVFLRQWRDLLIKRYAPGTVRRYLHALSGPLTAAVKDYEWLSSHPMRKVAKPRVTPGRVRFLSETERVALFAACAVSRNTHLATLVLLAVSVGARKNQLRFLRWGDVDLTAGRVRLLPSKSPLRRSVALLGPILPRLRQLGTAQSADAWLFPRQDGLKPVGVDVAFVRACKRAGIEDFVFHDLRHTCGSYLAMSGASIRDIAEVLGHTTIQQAMQYSHLTESHTRGVLQRMADTFLASLLAAATGTTLASVWLGVG